MQTTLECPNCHAQIDINDVLYHQLEVRFQTEHMAEKKMLEAEIESKRKEYKAYFDALSAKEEHLKLLQERYEENLQEQISQGIKAQKAQLRQSLLQEVQEEKQAEMELLKQQLQEKSKQLQELSVERAKVEQLTLELSEATHQATLKAQQEFTQKLQEESIKIRQRADEEHQLRLKEKEKQLEDQNRLIDEMKRKAQQGSMQLQGEVQELIIEEWLKDQYPFDVIEEIKKGQAGGDCIQRVHTRHLQNCATIYYESKRTKEFQPAWIEKFKSDIREKGADVGVLITATMPKGMERMGILEGVWVCGFEEFKGLSLALRQSAITLAQALKSQENRSDKMSLLYDYLTGNEFKMKVEAIVEGFTQMQSDLESEKRAMQRIWKQREKQLEKVMENTVGMYGGIQGIAGSAIGNIKALELPYSEDDLLEE